jgi:hypothetical protein
MATTQRPRHSKREFATRGEAIFEAKVRPGLMDKDDGRFVAIDIETGDFEIAGKELTACDRLYTRQPDAQIWLKRIGSRHLYKLRRPRPWP